QDVASVAQRLRRHARPRPRRAYRRRRARCDDEGGGGRRRGLRRAGAGCGRRTRRQNIRTVIVLRGQEEIISKSVEGKSKPTEEKSKPAEGKSKEEGRKIQASFFRESGFINELRGPLSSSRGQQTV